MLVTMSDKEIRRINVIQSVVEKRMRRRDAAHQLALITTNYLQQCHILPVSLTFIIISALYIRV